MMTLHPRLHPNQHLNSPLPSDARWCPQQDSQLCLLELCLLPQMPKDCLTLRVTEIKPDWS